MTKTITFEELDRQLNDPQQRAAFFERLIGRAVDILLPLSQARTPVRTGKLQSSEQTYVEPGGLSGSVWTDTTYAPFVHARIPFFDQAIDAAGPQLTTAMTEEGAAFLEELIT